MYTKVNSKPLVFFSLFSLVYSFAFPQYALAEPILNRPVEVQNIESYQKMRHDSEEPQKLAVLQNDSFMATVSPETIQVAYTLDSVITTAYSSTPDQTDSSPFITATGSRVRDGIIACNFLRFGTRVRFPELYGDKVFVVDDRMAKKNSHKIDIWFPSRQQALTFGVRYAKVEVLVN